MIKLLTNWIKIKASQKFLASFYFALFILFYSFYFVYSILLIQTCKQLLHVKVIRDQLEIIL